MLSVSVATGTIHELTSLGDWQYYTRTEINSEMGVTFLLLSSTLLIEISLSFILLHIHMRWAHIPVPCANRNTVH